MRELKRLNKFLLKYKGKLLLGLLITIISRVFSIVTPRLVGDSMTTIENYLSLSNISADELKDVLFLNIVLIFPIIGIGTSAVFDDEIFNRDFMVMSAFTAAFILLIIIGRQEGNLKKILYPLFGVGMFVSIVLYLTSLF